MFQPNTPVSNVQCLCVFYIDKQGMELCGYFTNMEEVMNYFVQAQINIDRKYQYHFEGQYIVVPAIYFNLKRKS